MPKMDVPAPNVVSNAAQSPPENQQAPPPTYEVRKEVAETAIESPTATDVAGIPKVLLTSEHSAMCRVRVGDSLPKITLPQLSGGETPLASLLGKRGTVVLFWGNDAWMSKTALEDLANLSDTNGVALVGIAVNLTNDEVQPLIDEVGAEFPQLVDADGKAFNQVGMSRMPRVYVLNESGKILWFDIEYSQSTKRELEQTLAVLAGDK